MIRLRAPGSGLNRDDIKVLIGGALFAVGLVLAMAGAAYAAEPKLPAGYSCADVRVMVAELGRVRAIALALRSGASWRQIREAQKCLP